MHPIANTIFDQLDIRNTLPSLYGISVPVSLLAGTAAILAKSFNNKSDTCSKCKRKREGDDDSSSDKEHDARPAKKARLTESQVTTAVDLSLSDATFVNHDFEDDDSLDDERERELCKDLGRRIKALSSSSDKVINTSDTSLDSFSISVTDTSMVSAGHRPIDSRFDFSSDTSISLTFDKDNSDIKPADFEPLLVSSPALDLASLSPSLNKSAKKAEAEDKGMHMDGYDPANARHEWELRWFVCAHHAAFTAATGMSLRREVRRRKALSRMWRQLRKENAVLQEENERLLLECRGFVEVEPLSR